MRCWALLLLAGLLGADDADKIVEQEMERQHIPGAAVAVLRDGRVVKARGYGWSNVELKTPATAESVFKIGSVSKQFIASGILILMQDGKLALDDRIAKYLEDAPAWWREVTLRRLLSHTSGIIREGPAFNILLAQPDIDVVRSAYSRPLDFPTGEKYQYCNVCYFALAEVITRLGGKPWPKFLEERLFTPLAMTATRTTAHYDLVPHRASGYTWENGTHSNVYPQLAVRPSGALLSTVIDLAKWDAALYGDTPLREATKKEAWTPVRLNNGSTYGYGLGWTIGESKGHAYVSHGGALAGFKAHFTRYTRDRLSVIVLTNLDQAVPGPIADRLGAHYLEH